MISPELLRQVELLEIRSRKAVTEVFAGEYTSAFKGRGMEFAEVRPYQPGDDIRAIDWNVTARSGEPFIKRFVEERELTVIFLVDRSASMRFGSVDRLKSDAAGELCALLGLAASENNDKVGLLLHGDSVERFVPPRKGQRHLFRVVREVLVPTDASRAPDPRRSHRVASTDAAACAADAVRHLASTLKRRAVVFYISDFLIDDRPASPEEPLPDAFETALRILARRHDVIALALSDRRERELPRSGLIELLGLESRRRLLLDTGSRRVRERFAAAADLHRRRLDERFKRLGVDLAFIDVNSSPVTTLLDLFRRRDRRRW